MPHLLASISFFAHNADGRGARGCRVAILLRNNLINQAHLWNLACRLVLVSPMEWLRTRGSFFYFAISYIWNLASSPSLPCYCFLSVLFCRHHPVLASWVQIEAPRCYQNLHSLPQCHGFLELPLVCYCFNFLSPQCTSISFHLFFCT